MAWTTPKTNFVSGDILTAAQMNAIGENLKSLINITSTTKTDTYSASLSANTFSSDVTGLTTTITPTTATSKVLVIVSVSATAESGVTVGGWRLMRNTTAIGVGTGTSNRVAISAYAASYDQGGGAQTFTFATLDSPATVSAVTYAVQIRNLSGLTRVHYVNRGYTDTDNSGFTRGASSITAIEVPV